MQGLLAHLHTWRCHRAIEWGAAATTQSMGGGPLQRSEEVQALQAEDARMAWLGCHETSTGGFDQAGSMFGCPPSLGPPAHPPSTAAQLPGKGLAPLSSPFQASHRPAKTQGHTCMSAEKGSSEWPHSPPAGACGVTGTNIPVPAEGVQLQGQPSCWLQAESKRDGLTCVRAASRASPAQGKQARPPASPCIGRGLWGGGVPASASRSAWHASSACAAASGATSRRSCRRGRPPGGIFRLQGSTAASTQDTNGSPVLPPSTQVHHSSTCTPPTGRWEGQSALARPPPSWSAACLRTANTWLSSDTLSSLFWLSFCCNSAFCALRAGWGWGWGWVVGAKGGGGLHGYWERKGHDA